MQTTFICVSYTPSNLKLLARRETPAQRSLTDSAACTNLELLSAMIGGPKQIEIAEAIVAHFKGDLHLLFQASVIEWSLSLGLARQLPRASNLHWHYRADYP